MLLDTGSSNLTLPRVEDSNVVGNSDDISCYGWTYSQSEMSSEKIRGVIKKVGDVSTFSFRRTAQPLPPHKVRVSQSDLQFKRLTNDDLSLNGRSRVP
jgi:hypothetical protein